MIPVVGLGWVEGLSVRGLIAACKRHGKHAGLGGVYTEDLMRQYIGMGTRFVLGANDFSLVLQGAQARAKFVRGL